MGQLMSTRLQAGPQEGCRRTEALELRGLALAGGRDLGSLRGRMGQLGRVIQSLQSGGRTILVLGCSGRRARRPAASSSPPRPVDITTSSPASLCSEGCIGRPAELSVQPERVLRRSSTARPLARAPRVARARSSCSIAPRARLSSCATRRRGAERHELRVRAIPTTKGRDRTLFFLLAQLRQPQPRPDARAPAPAAPPAPCTSTP